MPELGSSQSHLLRYAGQPGGDLSGSLDGFELELLRSAKIPEPLASTWIDNPLSGPVAAIPTNELTTAYVLDRAGATAWRVREIDLATGAVLATLANGTGSPDTMTMERGGAALLVAAHDFNLRVCRVGLDTLEVSDSVKSCMHAQVADFRLSEDDAQGFKDLDDVAAKASGGNELALRIMDNFEASLAACR